MSEDELTAEEQEQLQHLVGTATLPEEKFNVHSFLTKVVEHDDTTKLGNLSEEELGNPSFPLRTNKELALFCSEIADMPYMSDYFLKEGEILTSTSLSKEAKLLDLAVIQRREVGEITKKKPKKNGGWFKKKSSNE